MATYGNSAPIPRGWLLAGLMATILPASLAFAGVVGTGTAASCNQTTLDAQIQAGGTVTFSCGGAVSIPVQNLVIAATNPTTVIDGGGIITLDGAGNTQPIVLLNASPTSQPDITFRNIAFRNGNCLGPAYGGTGGAIWNLGKLTLDTVTLTLNTAKVGGGAIYQTVGVGCPLPSMTVRYSTFTSNQTAGNGGAIYVADGTATINDSDFSSSVAGADGGAIYLGYGLGATRSLSISNGHFNLSQALAGNGGAIAGWASGTGSITIDSSTFTQSGCSGTGFRGGAIFVDRTGLDIRGTLLQLNSSHDDSGGAIWAQDSVVTVSDTTFKQNGAANPGGSGGAVSLLGGFAATFQRSTFDHNVVYGTGVGAAMVTNGPVGIENCTISGNTSTGTGGYAGAIYVQTGTTDIRNSTITKNSAPSYGGIYVPGSGTLMMRNSILSGNTATSGANPDLTVNGSFTSNGYNMIGSSTGLTVALTDLINPNPNIGALANNGGSTFGNVVVVGPTLTHLPGSPLTDGGNPTGCLALGGGALTTDQRNLSRPSPAGGRCDIGAVEVQAAAPATKLAFVQQPTDAVAGATITPAVTVQVQDAGGNPVATAAYVTLSLASGSGGLSGTVTRQANASGLATYSDLWVNLVGTKTLSASSTGLTGATSNSFVISAGAAAHLTVSGGSGQSTQIGTAFGLPLQAVLSDTFGNPVSGGSVAFTAPGSGPSATLTGSPVTTDASGIASVTATANGLTGSYSVAAASGTLAPVNFALTNDPAPNQTNNVPALGTTGLVLFALAISAAGFLFVRRIG